MAMVPVGLVQAVGWLTKGRKGVQAYKAVAAISHMKLNEVAIMDQQQQK